MQSTSLAGRVVLPVEGEPLVALDREGTASRPGGTTQMKRPILHLNWKEAPHDSR
jgi:hypothetical protein